MLIAILVLSIIKQQTSKLNAIQFGPCDDPDCPTCNPIEDGEEWKRGHRTDN